MSPTLGMSAEAGQMAGYHERVTTEDSAEDTWYSVGRGMYLSFGTAKVLRNGIRKVSISGSTNAHSYCDELRLGLYLDESSDNVDYGTIAVYHYSDTNDVSVSGYETGIRAISGYYYSVRGVHMVIEGSVTESADSYTDAITAL